MKDPEINVDQLMYEIRETVARQRRASDRNGSAKFPLIAGSGPNLTDNSASLSLQPEFQLSDQYHIDDFLKFHGEDFVRNAYRALLKREPDPSGSTEYLRSLEGGRLNKVDILASLRYSAEGERAQVKVSGLAWPATIRQLERLPIIGYLLQMAIGVARLPRLLRHLRQSESYVLSRQERIVEYHNQLQRQMTEALAQTSEQMSAQISAQALAGTERADNQHQAIESLRLQQQSMAERQDEFMNSVEKGLTESREYADQVTAAVAGKLEEQTRQLSSQHQQLAAQTAEQTELLSKQQREQADQIQMATQAAEQQSRLFSERQQELAQQLEAQNQQLSQQQQELARQVEAQNSDLLRRQKETQTEIVMQERRLMSFVDGVGKQTSESAGQSVAQLKATEDEHLLDPLYASFEDQFRGDREEIKDRLRVYLPILKAGNVVEDVLDIGCGRGEWLEILSQEGVRARGLDRNRVFIAQCRQRGFDVVEADALAYLQSLPNGSLSAATSFHLVEHLPFEVLMKLLDEIVRTLRSGGLLILETPNPENVIVGSYSFYADPTHRNPIPSPTLQFLLESRGLSRIEVMKLRPWDAAKLDGDTELVKRFNEFFYSAPDYGIVGWKV
jgi:SAM-dependent methyltransferase